MNLCTIISYDYLNLHTASPPSVTTQMQSNHPLTHYLSAYCLTWTTNTDTKLNYLQQNKQIIPRKIFTMHGSLNTSLISGTQSPIRLGIIMDITTSWVFGKYITEKYYIAFYLTALLILIMLLVRTCPVKLVLVFLLPMKQG